MLIEIADPRASRATYERLIVEESNQLGLEVEVRAPDFVAEQRSRRAALAGRGGIERRSGGPVNSILPLLIDVVIVGGGVVATTAAATASKRSVDLLFDAIAARIKARKLGKAQQYGHPEGYR